MDKGVGRRKLIWSLFWIALLGSSAAGHGSVSILRGADIAPGERLVAELGCPASHITQVDPY